MIKILHSADWHLDSPLLGRTESQTRMLREALQAIPGKIAALCRQEQCDLLLLSGDLFDGSGSTGSCALLRSALASLSIPVFIAPGNHDFLNPDSPWLQTDWPENVHIFTRSAMEAVPLPALDCCVYGAGFQGMDCPSLLEGFRADCSQRYAIGVLHGDPTQTASPYCPITTQQIRDSGLDYLALGHIHKGASIPAGRTLCAWPGCPMGRGFDELGPKGVLVVTVDTQAECRFVPLDTPRFYDVSVTPGEDAQSALEAVLPPVGNSDFYRITLTGTAPSICLDDLYQTFARFPNLELRDNTLPPVDIWRAVGEDSFEGTYFRLLQQRMEEQDADARRITCLAAKISRQLLDGLEVTLP